jgi:hypothetical protein
MHHSAEYTVQFHKPSTSPGVSTSHDFTAEMILSDAESSVVSLTIGSRQSGVLCDSLVLLYDRHTSC